MKQLLSILLLAGAMAARAADPVVSNVTTSVRCTDPTMVDVTFTITDADGDDCWVFPFAHDPNTRETIPMTCFAVQGGTLSDLATRKFSPGTHTITWLPGGDWGGPRPQPHRRVRARLGNRG